MQKLALAMFTVLLSLSSCTTEAKESTTKEYTVGCAHCLPEAKVEGITTCTPAVIIDGKAMVIVGSGIDMKKADICAHTRKCKMDGKVEGSQFKAGSDFAWINN